MKAGTAMKKHPILRATLANIPASAQRARLTG